MRISPPRSRRLMAIIGVGVVLPMAAGAQIGVRSGAASVQLTVIVPERPARPGPDGSMARRVGPNVVDVELPMVATSEHEARVVVRSAGTVPPGLRLFLRDPAGRLTPVEAGRSIVVRDGAMGASIATLRFRVVAEDARLLERIELPVVFEVLTGMGSTATRREERALVRVLPALHR